MLKPNNAVTTNLIKARELIADEKDWCHDGHGVDKDQLCSIQALYVVSGMLDMTGTPQHQLLTEAAVSELGRIRNCFSCTTPILAVNSKGHAAVMRVFERAIELSLQEPTPTPAD